MRLKYVENGHEILKDSEKVICCTKGEGIHLSKIFKNTKPIHGEFGAGRGGFSKEMALRNPDKNFLAFERSTKVIVKGLHLMEPDMPENLYYVHMDVGKVEEILGRGIFERLYLNFSDPWPKKKHAKRRLSHESFLILYEGILKEKGDLILKTDQKALYEFSLEMFDKRGWQLLRTETDLHRTQLKEDNVMTEYEQKFVAEGKPIYYIHAQKPAHNEAIKP